MEIRHNNYADCFVNRGKESSVDKLIQLNYRTDLPFASQPAVQDLYSLNKKSFMVRMLTDTLPPQTFPIPNVLQSHCDKNRYTLVVHTIQKLLRAPAHPRPSQPLDLIGWWQTIWLLDWLPYAFNIYFDLKRQRSHSRRISMRFKCLRSVWDVCCGTIITRTTTKIRT